MIFATFERKGVKERLFMPVFTSCPCGQEVLCPTLDVSGFFISHHTEKERVCET